MKLTPELVEGAAQYIHPATRDRELDLRGYKIPVIENLGATLDQFDSIDFSDNDVKKLENFPLLKRIIKLLFNNNRIVKLDNKLEEALPNLEWLIMTNNEIQELGDLDPLTGFKKLKYLSLMNNPVATKKHYREYVIYKIPSVRVLDFHRVRLRERQEAAKMFKGKKGKELEKEISVKSNKFVPGEPLTNTARPGHTPQDVESIKAAISKAQTLEEIERLNQLLKAGFVPGKNDALQRNDNGDANEIEMEME
ncbi:U2 small nuclear ribonucleoprotein A' [Halotydeus destructor]|nr:U2 small nuclear ribonucleoprotein A' [Halotydeus destructor]